MGETGAEGAAAEVKEPTAEELAQKEAEAKVAAEKEALAEHVEEVLSSIERIELERSRGWWNFKAIGHSTQRVGHGKTIVEAVYDAGYRYEAPKVEEPATVGSNG